MDFYFEQFWRMDWGLGNPNKTATIIACLMIGVWMLAYVWRRGFWLALALFVGLGICLVHTYSRGGVLALMTGIVPVLWFAPRPWPRRRIIALVVAFWIVIGAVLGLSAYKRYGQGVVTQDRSITNRLEIWKYAPAMMVDAPGGWGLGQAPIIYSRWYQPLERNERYISLVNGHLTWMVEFSWLGRAGYVFAWMAVFFLCWPTAGRRERSVAFGIWLAFFVASVFTAVGDNYWTWIVPVLALCVVLVQRIFRRDLPPAWAAGASGAVAAAVCLAFFVAGRGDRGIRGGMQAVIIGKGKPDAWVLVDTQVLGKEYGRTLRSSKVEEASRILSESEEAAGRRFHSIGFALHPKDLGDTTGTVLLISGTTAMEDPGMLAGKASAAREIILLQPGFAPDAIPWPAEVTKRLTVAFGEFSQSDMASIWKDKAKVTLLEGVGDFVPEWPRHVSSLLEASPEAPAEVAQGQTAVVH